MNNEEKKPTWVVGHKNPDTDSICSAIVYSMFKTKTRNKVYIPKRAGNINEETKFVLDYFNVEAPELISSVNTQVHDIEIRHMAGASKYISLKKAWNLMQEAGVVTLPAVNSEGMLEGLITVSDLAKSYMNIYDSAILSKANTAYSNIIETLEGTLVVGDDKAYFNKGKVLIAAANPDMMENYIAKDDLVILGNRYETQLCAIEMDAACIIVCEGAAVSNTIQKLAADHHTTIITTNYDAYTAARLINQAMPIKYFMKTDNLITFEEDDFLDEIRDVMASVRHRDFPILDKDGRYLGMISRRNLLGAKGKRLILVDHNEKSQAVDGVEHAHVVEIIDHHRLGTIETISPVFFRNQPLGCTSTIIYQMCKEQKIDIDKTMAGLLCSAIISDTLLFRSPTCTEIDKKAAEDLAAIAGINPEEYAHEMFAAGSNLKGKTDEEIFYQDFKKFTLGKISMGVSQISSLNKEELDNLKERMKIYLKEVLKTHDVDMLFFMLTNILEERTTLLCVGQGAEQLVETAFHMDSSIAARDHDGVVDLMGVVSRKKQLMPALMMGVEG